jgi:hypothetical protein
MSKISQIDKAIAALDYDIAVLQQARAKLVQQQQPKAGREIKETRKTGQPIQSMSSPDSFRGSQESRYYQLVTAKG